MRQLVERALRIGTGIFAFLVAVLLAMPVLSWAEPKETEKILQISPEVVMEGNSRLSVHCEIENKAETEIPEVQLLLKLPEGIGTQRIQFAEATVTRGEGAAAVTETRGLTENGQFDWQACALKPGEHCSLQLEGRFQEAEERKNYSGFFEVIATVRRSAEQHITRRRYQLSGVDEQIYTVLSSALLNTERDAAANQRVALQTVSPAVGQLSMIPAQAEEGHSVPPHRGIPLIEILVCSMALWTLNILVRQFLVYLEEGKRKFDPNWKPFEERQKKEEEKKDR